jgi:coenzyme F420-0:L-glutamate ligase/coenzyme F420-1:gamma-L-glutamate ligase
VPDPDVVGFEVVALQGVGEISAGDDLAAALLAGGVRLRDGDVLVVSSKVVSKAAGLSHPAARRDDVVAAQSVRVVAERRTPRGLASIVESAAGPVMAAAGVDASNVPPGTVLSLPSDADAAARALRERLRELGSPRIAVVVSDTAGRAWRTGQTDFALGCAGLVVTDDLRGTTDASGTVLEVTERVVADEVAAAADLVKGKARGVPAAVVRGLAALVTDDDGPGARSLLRPAASDWFRLGHVEAVRAALGVPHGEVEPPAVTAEPLLHKVRRAVSLAATSSPVDTDVLPRDEGSCTVTLTAADPFARGWVAARLAAALWSEDLDGTVEPDAGRELTRVMVTRLSGGGTRD